MKKWLNRSSRKSTAAAAHAAPATAPASSDPVADALPLLAGTFRVRFNGACWFQPDDPSAPTLSLDPAECAAALPGDRIEVVPLLSAASARLFGAPDARPEKARFRRVLSRRRTQIVGTLRLSPHYAYLVPRDPLVRQNIRLSDPPSSLADRQGQLAVARLAPLADLPAGAPPSASFLRVLGDPDAPALDIPALLADHDLSPDFPSPVLDAARSAAVPSDPARRDLRSECILTIDPHDARDYDDAVSAAPLPAGGWRVAVHIADVAAFVPPDSPVDLEARRRGNTTYLVDRTIRMLPEDLTVRVCSLQPHEDHLAHTVEFTVAADGSVTPGPTYRSLIRSRACLSYDEVQAHFDGAPLPARADAPDLRAALSALRAASAAMRRRRFLDGALDFALPEVHCTLDPSGNPLSFEKRRAPEAYALIEECMLAANRAVAQKLDAASFPAPWRVHPQPEPDQWTRMAAELRALGVPGPAPATSDDLNRIARAVADSPLRYIVTLTLLRNLQRAVYAPSAAPHFGLGFRRYLHFTSPIRRYPDLVAHRLLTALEDGLPPPLPASDVAELARHCSATEKESADMEAESLLVKRIRYYAALLARGENGPWPGTIIALNPKGLLVELVDTLQTGLLPYSALGRERFTLAPDDYVATSTRGSQYRLGQTVDVSIASIDEKTRRLDFYLPSIPPRPPRSARSAKKPSTKPAPKRPRKKRR